MMGFLVDDLLDFAQINAGKFRKVITSFDLKEAIEEVVNIQKDKAQMGGIKLSSSYHQQNLSQSKVIVSLFNPSSKDINGEDHSDLSDGKAQASGG